MTSRDSVAPAPIAGLPIVVGLLALAVIVGSFGPWASLLFFSVGGMESDGLITLVLGASAGAFILARLAVPGFHRTLMLLAAACFVLSAGVGIYSWAHLRGFTNVPAEAGIRVGWGLVIMTMASLVGTLLAARDAVSAPESSRSTR